MTWAESAQRAISAIIAGLPEDHTYIDARKALRAASRRFTMGTSWGGRIWPRECQRYLRRHYTQGCEVSSGVHKINRDDIVFPFREN